MKTSILHFYPQRFQFSAGHFTIFSATEREPLHGHNYMVEASIVAKINQPGLTFDYRLFREKLTSLCEQLHLKFLLPDRSPYLNIEESDDEYIIAIFNQKRIPFLKEDILLLPMSNVTLEELSQWFINQLLQDQTFIQVHQIESIIINVYNGSDQSAEAKWCGN